MPGPRTAFRAPPVPVRQTAGDCRALRLRKHAHPDILPASGDAGTQCPAPRDLRHWPPDHPLKQAGKRSQRTVVAHCGAQPLTRPPGPSAGRAACRAPAGGASPAGAITARRIAQPELDADIRRAISGSSRRNCSLSPSANRRSLIASAMHKITINWLPVWLPVRLANDHAKIATWL